MSVKSRLISSIPIPDPSYKRERYELDFSELDNIIANNSDESSMAEVKSGHFVATHDVKGLLWSSKTLFFYPI